MDFNEYLKTRPLKAKLWLRWYRFIGWLTKPFKKYIYCSHTSTFGQVGGDEAYCLDCEKVIVVDATKDADDPEYLKAVQKARKALNRKKEAGRE